MYSLYASFITEIELFNSLAINSARNLSFSIIFILVDSKDSSMFLARLKPILPPPIIKMLFEIFSSQFYYVVDMKGIEKWVSKLSDYLFNYFH